MASICAKAKSLWVEVKERMGVETKEEEHKTRKGLRVREGEKGEKLRIKLNKKDKGLTVTFPHARI